MKEQTKQTKELKTSLKIQLKKVERISKKGLKMWGARKRYKIYQYVFKTQRLPNLSAGVPLNLLNSKQKLCDMVWENVGTGTYYVCYPSHKKNKYKCSFVTICCIELTAVGDMNQSYSVKQFLIKPKWRRRMASFKRIVEWKEEQESNLRKKE